MVERPSWAPGVLPVSCASGVSGCGKDPGCRIQAQHLELQSKERGLLCMLFAAAGGVRPLGLTCLQLDFCTVSCQLRGQWTVGSLHKGCTQRLAKPAVT